MHEKGGLHLDIQNKPLLPEIDDYVPPTTSEILSHDTLNDGATVFENTRKLQDLGKIISYCYCS